MAMDGASTMVPGGEGTEPPGHVCVQLSRALFEFCWKELLEKHFLFGKIVGSPGNTSQDEITRCQGKIVGDKACSKSSNVTVTFFSAVGTGAICWHFSFSVSWIARFAMFPEWYNHLLGASNYGVSCPNFSNDIGIKKIDFWNQVAK